MSRSNTDHCDVCHMPMPKKTRDKPHAQIIVERELARAKSMLGPGWSHVSDDLRWGLLCANILGVIAIQAPLDDANATDASKARIAEYALELYRAAHVLRENGWTP